MPATERDGANGGRLGLVAGLVVAVAVALVLLRGDDVAPKGGDGVVPAERASEGGAVGVDAPLPGGDRTLVTDATTAADGAAPGAAEAVPQIALSGRVLAWPGATPIPDATIRLRGVEAQTDSRGHYEIAVPWRPDEMHMDVAATGFQAKSQSVLLHEPGSAVLDVELFAWRRVQVQVVDRSTGASIVGAHVSGRSGTVNATTDADGRAEVEVVDRGATMLSVEAEEHCPLVWHSTPPDGRAPFVRLAMLGVAHVEGTVRDTAGHAIAGAIVQLRIEGPLLARVGESSPQGVTEDRQLAPMVRSADDGSYRIALRPGSEPQELVASKSEYVDQTGAPVVIATAGETQRCDFVMQQGGRVTGRVRCNGEVRRGSVVRWQNGATSGGGAPVDKFGGYQLRDVLPGSVEIRLCDGAEGTVLRSRVVPVVAGEEQQCDFEWSESVAPVHRIAGTVVDGEGVPVAGAMVLASLEETKGRSASARSGADGRFTVDVAAPGTYQLWALTNEFRKVGPQSVDADTMDVRIVLADLRMRTVRLLFRDADTAEPLCGRLYWRLAGETAFTPAMAQADLHGVAPVPLPVGVVDLRAVVVGYAPVQLDGLAIGDVPADVPLLFRRGATLRLRLADPQSLANEVPRRQVVLLDDAQVGSVKAPWSASTYAARFLDDAAQYPEVAQVHSQIPRFGPDGSATVTGLAPGRYHLVVFPDDVALEPATLTVGPGVSEVDLALRRK